MRDETTPVSIFEKAALVALLAWLCVFVAYKIPHFLSPMWIEWDARMFALPLFRVREPQLFGGDLGVAFVAALHPVGWRALLSLLAMLVNPYVAGRIVAFFLFGLLLWQVFAFARAKAGLLVAAATVFLVARCPFFWDRIAGGNPRAFGLPLIVAYLRYASEGRSLAAAVAVAAQAAFYPSAMLVCAPAFAAQQAWEAWRRRRARPLVLVAICAVTCAALVAPLALHDDPRLGHPITYEEMGHLKQRGIWSLYPLPSHSWVFARAAHISLEDEVADPPLPPRWDSLVGNVVMGLAGLVFLAAFATRRIPPAFVLVGVSSLGAYGAGRVFAYRLYVPDRLIHYAAPPLILLLFLPLTVELYARLVSKRRAAEVCVASVVLLTLAAGGSGLTSFSGQRDWSSWRTPGVDFIAGLPAHIVVASTPVRSSGIQIFARRSVLFSSITSMPHYSTFATTVESRIAEFYQAYYSSSLEAVRAFVRSEHVDYLLVDLRDFGPDAMKNARYVSPWTEFAQERIIRARGTFALAAPPPDAVVYRDGPVVVLDAAKL